MGARRSGRLSVLHVHHDMRRGSGGQRSVGEIIRGVDPNRFRSLLVILVRRLEIPETNLDGIEIVPITGRHPGTPWWKELRFARTLGRLIAREGIDIVHTHEDTGYRLGVVAAQMGGARVIRTHRVLPSSEHCRFGITARLWRELTYAYTVVSPDLAPRLRRYHKVPAHRVRCIPNGIVPSEFDVPSALRAKVRRELRVGVRDFLVAGIGRLQPIKDFRTWLLAFHQASQNLPGLRGFIAGDGPERERLEATVAHLELATKVKMLGFRRDIALLLAASDCFFITSESEGCPRTALEAMASGKPVVCSDVPGLRYVVKPGETGFCFRSGETASASDALLKLAGNPSLAEGMGRKGRERAVAKFSLAAVIRQYEQLYEQVASSNGRFRG